MKRKIKNNNSFLSVREHRIEEFFLNKGKTAFKDEESFSKSLQDLAFVLETVEIESPDLPVEETVPQDRSFTPGELTLIQELILEHSPNALKKTGSYFDKEEAGKAISDMIAQAVSSLKIPTPAPGKNGKPGPKGDKGKTGDDGSPDTGSQIVNKIRAVGLLRLKDIKGAEKIISVVKGLVDDVSDLKKEIKNIPRLISLNAGGSGGDSLPSTIEGDDEAVSIKPVAPVSNAPYSIVSDEPTTNLVVNPKFEANITDGWSTTGTVTATRDTSVKWYGSASLKLVSSAANAGAVTTINVEPNSTYVFSIMVEGAAGGESIKIDLTPNSGTAVSSIDAFGGVVSTTTPVTTNWQRLRLAITTNGSATSLACAIRSAAGGSQTMYIDGVQLEKKSLPSNSTNTYFASAYCDGSLGTGHTWSGTADNSSSSRVAGTHFLAPITDDNAGGFVQRSDGSIERMYFRSDEAFSNQGLSADDPSFPYQFIGKTITNLLTSGIRSGIAYVENLGNGVALYVKSSATTAATMVIEGSSITTGAILQIFANADLTTMISNGGKFFEFADKNKNSSFQWSPVFSQSGVFSLPYQDRYTFTGGGGQTTTDRTGLSGTISITSGSTAVTGASTAFLDDYRRGDTIQIYNAAASVYDAYNIASVESDTALSLEANMVIVTATGVAHKGRERQWSPANIQLAGAYSDHNYLAATGTYGDYLYNVYPNGSEGQLHVMKSSTRQDVTAPTENSGDALVTKKFVDTTTRSISATTDETDLITGYTVPANMLGAGKILRVKFFGELNSLLATSKITWRVKLGGVTILETNNQETETGNIVHFVGEADIVGVDLESQKSVFKVEGKNNVDTAAWNYAKTIKTASSAVDCRLDQALTVTGQYDDDSDLDMEVAYIELI